MHTYESLKDKTLVELNSIKQEKMNDLFKLRRQKDTVISNIIQLQNMAEVESKDLELKESEED